MKRKLTYDTTGFADLIEKIKKAIQTLEWELENAAWIEDEVVKKIQILHGNLRAVLDICEVESSLSIEFAMRLFAREVDLWTSEILPNLRLNKKYLDIGKLKTIELQSIRGHQMERSGFGFNEAMPRFIKIAGDRYLISDKTWTPIPPIDANDEANFFSERELFKIHIALKTSRPVSEREKQAQAAKSKADADANRISLEADLLTGEK